MISFEQMEKCKNKNVELRLKKAEVYSGLCTNFYWAEDEDEENMLEFGNILVNQSEIKSI